METMFFELTGKQVDLFAEAINDINEQTGIEAEIISCNQMAHLDKYSVSVKFNCDKAIYLQGRRFGELMYKHKFTTGKRA